MTSTRRAVPLLATLACLCASLAAAPAPAGPPSGQEPCAAPLGAAAQDAWHAAPTCEPGIAPSPAAPAPPEGGATGIGTLAAGAGGPREPAVPGEALLVLPRGPGGRVPTDFELAAGVRVAASFWSSVVCATIARLAGPVDLPPGDWLREPPPEVSLVPNHLYVPAAASVSEVGPDPYVRFQYGLARTGAERARPVTDGRGARVALLDSAPDVRHRELRSVRVLPAPDGASDESGVHGTLMAGIIAATEHNAFGIAGVAPGAELVAVPVCRPAAAGATECPLFDLLRGVETAWEEQAQIVNLSLVGPPNPLLERAMTRLDELGVVVVGAAGNEDTAEPRYPAAYPSVVGVGAVDRAGRRFPRANRGPSAEIEAPGVQILSTIPDDGFAFGDGTSLAAAHVSGELALLTAVTHDAGAARTALFTTGARTRAASGPGVAVLPPVCDVLARLGHPCP